MKLQFSYYIVFLNRMWYYLFGNIATKHFVFYISEGKSIMTRKIICFALALLTASAMLSGCNSFNNKSTEAGDVTIITQASDSQVQVETEITSSEQPAETTLQETDSETAATIDENDPNVQYSKKRVEELIGCIKEGNNAEVSKWLMTGEKYDFFDDFTLDSYTMKLSSDQYFGDCKSFDVVFNISGSSCDLFPNGQSSWRITSGDGVIYIYEFYPLDKVQEMHEKNEVGKYQGKYDGTLLKKAYKYGYKFSHAIGYYEISNEDLINYKCSEGAIHNLYHAVDLPSEQNVPVSDIVAQIKQIYNITVSEEDFCNVSRFNGLIENGVMVQGCGHGGGTNFFNLKSSEETDSTITVNIEYYGDGGYLIPVRESSYVFNKNSDGTITLDSVSQVYDTGKALGEYGV